MKKANARLIFVLSFVAATVSFAVALIGFIRQREFSLPLIATGCFLLAFGVTAARQIRRGPRA
jgi:hypothetical protein